MCLEIEIHARVHSLSILLIFPRHFENTEKQLNVNAPYHNNFDRCTETITSGQLIQGILVSPLKAPWMNTFLEEYEK